MKYKHEKDIRYAGIGYNTEWIRKHTTEAEFLKKQSDLNSPLTETQSKELYAFANMPEVPETVAEVVPEAPAVTAIPETKTGGKK